MRQLTRLKFLFLILAALVSLAFVAQTWPASPANRRIGLVTPTPLPPAAKRAPEAYPFQTGYPVNPNKWLERSSPTIIDVNNDGVNELLIGDFEGRIFAFSPSGQTLNGYPLQVDGPIYGHLAFADLDNHNGLEIVVGAGSVNNGGQGHVYVFHPDGTL